MTGQHTRGAGNRDVMRRKRKKNDETENESTELIKQLARKKGTLSRVDHQAADQKHIRTRAEH